MEINNNKNNNKKTRTNKQNGEEEQEEPTTIYVCCLCSRNFKETIAAAKHLGKYHKVNWLLIEEIYPDLEPSLIRKYMKMMGYEEANLKKWK